MNSGIKLMDSLSSFEKSRYPSGTCDAYYSENNEVAIIFARVTGDVIFYKMIKDTGYVYEVVCPGLFSTYLSDTEAADFITILDNCKCF